MKEMFNILIRHNLTPNQFYYLWSIKESVTTPKINNSLEHRVLKRQGWIDDNNKLTDKSFQILKNIEGFFKAKVKKTSDQILGNNYDAMLEKYNNLFPKRRLPSGKSARSAKGNLEPAFRWFFQNYNYDWETILKATAMYLDERELANWNFTQNSQYFVRKQNTDKTWASSLADFCMQIEDGLDTDNKNHFSEKVF